MSARLSAAIAFLTLLMSGCLIEAPQSVPSPPSARSLVVAAPVWDGDCVASCPTAARGEHLGVCHLTKVSSVLTEHRAALGERPSGYYLVCDYEND